MFNVVVLGFYIPPTAKVILRKDLGLMSHPKDWRSPGSNPRPWFTRRVALPLHHGCFQLCFKEEVMNNYDYSISVFVV